LIAVEVSVEGRADQRMDLDCAALDQDRLECLNTQTVERRRAVEQDRMVLDDLFEDIPDLGSDALEDAFGRFDVVGESLFNELAHDERLEQFKRHALGQTALVELQGGT